MTIEKLKQICDTLQATSSRIAKENILKEQSENQEFRDLIYFVLNSYITTGLASKKINKVVKCETNKSFSNLFEMLNYIKNNPTGTDEIVSNVQNYISQFDTDIQDFIKSIVTKSLTLGVDAKTVNKVWGKGFIPTFECMLANKYFDKPEYVEGKDFTITLKLDGIRCLIVKDNGKVSLFSRQGQPIEGLIDIEEEIQNFDEDNIVLDGELLISNTTNIPSKEQYKETTKIVRKDGLKTGITYWVFDVMSLESFKTQNCKLPYSDRRKWLNQNFQDNKCVKSLPDLYSGNDVTQIHKTLNKVRNDGQEGCMININDAPYEFKRTNNLLKCKVMQDCDLKIIGFEEGQGRLTGTLGRINVDYKGNVLGVGSGFSDSDRQYFWANKDNLMGRVISINYFEETQDKDGKLSLRFPVYKELREVGKEVSYN